MAEKKDIRNNEKKDETFDDLVRFDKADSPGNDVLDQPLMNRAFNFLYPKNIRGDDGYVHNSLRGGIGRPQQQTPGASLPGVSNPGQAPQTAPHGGNHRGTVTDPKHDHRLSENQTKDKDREDEKKRRLNEEQQEEMAERLHPDERNRDSDDEQADEENKNRERPFIEPRQERKRTDHRASLYRKAMNSYTQNAYDANSSAGPSSMPVQPQPAPVTPVTPDPRLQHIMAHPYGKKLLGGAKELTPAMIDQAWAQVQNYNALNPATQRPATQVAIQNNSDAVVRELSRKYLPMDRKATLEELNALRTHVREILVSSNNVREKNSFQKIASAVASLILLS